MAFRMKITAAFMYNFRNLKVFQSPEVYFGLSSLAAGVAAVSAFRSFLINNFYNVTAYKHNFFSNATLVFSLRLE